MIHLRRERAFRAAMLSGAVVQGALEIKATPNKEILKNGGEYLIEQPGARPLAVAAVTGLVGGKLDRPLANGQIVPRFVSIQLPENGVQNEALVDGRSAASGSGFRRVDERLKLSPLFVG
jgi:hypothetical protein